MDASRFFNALRIMYSLDMHELVDAGVIDGGHSGPFLRFSKDPLRECLRYDDDRQEKLFALIESRQPEGAS